jgi:hypothetical protein
VSKPNRVSAFARDQSDYFIDPKKEEFAREIAKGKLLKTACEAVDITLQTGIKWRQASEMEERLRALRAGADTYVGVSTSYLLNRLRMNAERASTEGKFKESTDALLAMHKIMAADKGIGKDQGVPEYAGDMTAEELAKARAEQFPSPLLPSDTRVMVEDEEGVFTEELEGTLAEVFEGEPLAVDMEKALTKMYAELPKPFDPADEG